MFDWIKELFVKKYAQSIIRHALTALVGILLSSSFPGLKELGELIQANIGSLEQVLVAAIVGLFALVWSFKEKKADEVVKTN